MMSGRHAVPAPPFWEVLTLAEMTPEQWEALCDGCGRCCLQKLRDKETREVFYTSVACRLLDIDACRCTQYEDRRTIIPACVVLTPDRICPVRLASPDLRLPAHPRRQAPAGLASPGLQRPRIGPPGGHLPPEQGDLRGPRG